MYVFSKKYLYSLVVVLSAVSSTAWASWGCYRPGNNVAVMGPPISQIMANFGTVTVPDSLELGGVIASTNVSGVVGLPPYRAYSCTISSGADSMTGTANGQVGSGALVLSPGVDPNWFSFGGMPVVGSTNVAGVGVRIVPLQTALAYPSTLDDVSGPFLGRPVDGQAGSPLPQSTIFTRTPTQANPSPGQLPGYAQGPFWMIQTGLGGVASYKVELIKTAPSVTGGTLTGPAYNAKLYSSSGFRMLDFTILFGATTIIGVAGCTVDPSSVALNVDMGQVTASTFNGVGSMSEAKTFNIRLSNCQVGTAVNIRLDGAQVSTLPGVLGLTPSSGQTQVAAGVGIQLQMNGVPVTLNSPFLVQASAPAGQLSIPLTARYIQTDNVVPGQANSTVAFTMSYQ